jgi:chromosomal replication initiation ATPase DnaA
MYTREDLKVACKLYSKGVKFVDIVELLEFNDSRTGDLTISLIFKKVCNYFGTHPNMVRGKSRRVEYVKSRAFFSYISCIDYGISQVEVARIINKERSVLVHYNSKIQGYIDVSDPETTRDIKNIREILKD